MDKHCHVSQQLDNYQAKIDRDEEEMFWIEERTESIRDEIISTGKYQILGQSPSTPCLFEGLTVDEETQLQQAQENILRGMSGENNHDIWLLIEANKVICDILYKQAEEIAKQCAEMEWSMR